jgi:fructokinase
MIVVAGEALTDLLVHPDGSLAAVPGGGPFNTARTIARLGGEVAFLGALSTDRFGRNLRDALEADGVDLSMTTTTDAPTTLAIAELDGHGSATYRFHTSGTSAAELRAEVLAAALAARPDALHVGTLGLVMEPMASVISDGLAGADDGTLVMLDPNCRPLAIADRSAYLRRLDAVVARSDVVKASVDDLAYLRPGIAAADAARGLLDQGPTVVILTDGGRLVRVRTRDDAFDVPVPPVDIVDTVGAGDAFGGAFIARWIDRGWGRADLADREHLRDAVTFAIEVAAETCTRQGAEPPRRPVSETPPARPV